MTDFTTLPISPDPTDVSRIGPAPESIPTSIETFLQTQIHRYFAAHGGGLPAPGLYDRLLARVEKPLIIQTLRATGGNQIKAAHILGLNRNTLRKKMRTLGIDARTVMIRGNAA